MLCEAICSAKIVNNFLVFMVSLHEFSIEGLVYSILLLSFFIFGRAATFTSFLLFFQTE